MSDEAGHRVTVLQSVQCAWPVPRPLPTRAPDVLAAAELAAIAADVRQGRIPALSVRQPYAHYILYCGKDVENRSWKTAYRGWLLLHVPARALPGASREMPRSAHIGMVEIIDCVAHSDSPWFAGPYGLILGRRIALKKAIRANGSPGLFKPSLLDRSAVAAGLKTLT